MFNGHYGLQTHSVILAILKHTITIGTILNNNAAFLNNWLKKIRVNTLHFLGNWVQHSRTPLFVFIIKRASLVSKPSFSQLVAQHRVDLFEITFFL